MQWKKLIIKFIVGLGQGGIATLATTQDIDTSGKVALITGLITAIINYIKHRKD